MNDVPVAAQDQLETIQRILGSNFMWSIKKDRLLALTLHSSLIHTKSLYESKYLLTAS